ncbi:MAG TPA: hypothetical protein VLL08_31525 [Kineosporiaceae bacterium]|nr:hypothetical protein [Kineosporiaceae bacterium]
MSARERARQSPLSALLAFVLLAGLSSMHGLASHQVSALVWLDSRPVESAAHVHPSMSGSGQRVVTTSNLVTKNTPVAKRGPVAMGASTGAEHRMLDLCVAVLSLLLLFRTRAHAMAQTSHHRERLTSILWALSRAPPPHLRPSLTGLCIARV